MKYYNYFLNIIKIILYALKIISSIIVTAFLLWIIYKSNDLTTKIVTLPFLICAIMSTGFLISHYLKKNNLKTLFQNLYIVGFLLFWFGMLIYSDYTCLIEKQYDMLLFTIPFWIIGIFIIYKKIRRKH